MIFHVKIDKNDGGKFLFFNWHVLLFCEFLRVIFSSGSYHMILVLGFDPMVTYPCSYNSSLDCVKFGAFVVFSISLKFEFCDISIFLFVKFDS